MKTIKYAFKKEWYNIIFLLLPFLIIPFIWDQLPVRIPTHWNLQGEIDGYSTKSFGVLFMPILAIGIYFLLLYLPKIDPKKRIKIDQKPIPILRSFLVLMLFGIQCLMVLIAMDIKVGEKLILLGLPLFFVVMGNYLRTVKPNYFIGIRLPWTLESADNWRKTHRFGSYLWVGGGAFLILLFPFFDSSTFATISVIGIMLLAFIPILYSFYLYKKPN